MCTVYLEEIHSNYCGLVKGPVLPCLHDKFCVASKDTIDSAKAGTSSLATFFCFYCFLAQQTSGFAWYLVTWKASQPTVVRETSISAVKVFANAFAFPAFHLSAVDVYITIHDPSTTKVYA